MEEYTINITEVENLQTLNDVDALTNLFTKAERTIKRGGTVILVRSYTSGTPEKVEEFSTEDAFEEYRQRVFKYLS